MSGTVVGAGEKEMDKAQSTPGVWNTKETSNFSRVRSAVRGLCTGRDGGGDGGWEAAQPPGDLEWTWEP